MFSPLLFRGNCSVHSVLSVLHGNLCHSRHVLSATQCSVLVLLQCPLQNYLPVCALPGGPGALTSAPVCALPGPTLPTLHSLPRDGNRGCFASSLAACLSGLPTPLPRALPFFGHRALSPLFLLQWLLPLHPFYHKAPLELTLPPTWTPLCLSAVAAAPMLAWGIVLSL